MPVLNDDYVSIEAGYPEDSPWDEAHGGAPYWFDAPTQKRWRKFVGGLLEGQHLSTDVPELSQFDYHYVFVYGTLKKSGGNRHMLKDAEFIAKAWTKLKCYIMVKNGLPAVVICTGAKAKAIQGEVYKLSVSHLKDLDCFESNGVMYRRRKTIIETDKGDELKAWMYLGVADVFDPIANPACPHFVRKSNNVPYYTYVRK